MSDLSAILPPPLGHPQPAAEALHHPPRTWLWQVVLDTVGRTGAKIGLVWVVIIGLCAVFAPFLANSYPLLVKINDQWSSPLIRHLAVTDVVILIGAALAGIMALWRGPKAAHRTRAFLTIFGWVLLAAYWSTVIRPFVLQGQSDWTSAYRNWRQATDTDTARFPLGSLALWLLGWAAFLAFAWALARCTYGMLRRPGISAGLRLTALGLAAMLTFLLLAFPIRPPLLDVYDQYRHERIEGRVQVAIPTLVPYSPRDHIWDQFTVATPPPRPPSRAHWMGTETNGADILSRMIYACRSAMAIGLLATGIAIFIGSIIGGLMGYFVGAVDLLGMRLVEIFSAIPTFYLILTCVAFFGRNIYIIAAIIGVTGWVGDARFVRAEFLRLRQQDFVVAARACALPLRSILFRHMLPNGMAPLLVSASFGIASAVFLEAMLSFLGVGPVDQPSWGELLNQAVRGSEFYWWLAVFPGVAIFVTVLAYNLVGESLRDAIDPHSRRVAQL